ncbi:putative nucleotide-binding alpha-beta plait domain superfamily, RNA-binding domain superfamily [Helianthus anomalus]
MLAKITRGTEWEGDKGDVGIPWTKVQYRKNRRSSGDVSRTLLWRAFQRHGFVTDAYVSCKKDSCGNNFRFIRYVSVENLENVLEDMNVVKIYEEKLVVSLANYDKNHNKCIHTLNVLGGKYWKPMEPNQACKQTNGEGSLAGTAVRDGELFLDLFQNKTTVNGQGSKTITVEGNGSTYLLHCIGRSIDGEAKT